MVRFKNEIRCKTVREELQDMYYKTSAAAEDMTKKSLNVLFFKLQSILFIYVPPTHTYTPKWIPNISFVFSMDDGHLRFRQV